MQALFFCTNFQRTSYQKIVRLKKCANARLPSFHIFYKVHCHALFYCTFFGDIFVNENVPKKMCNKKVHGDELCKKYEKRAGGRQHLFLGAQFFRKWFSKNLCNKKVPKSALYFIIFIQGGRFQQKELGQHIFFVGGGWWRDNVTVYQIPFNIDNIQVFCT